MLKFWITSVFNENLQETLEGWIGRNLCFHNFTLFYFTSGESLKKSHLMDSSSDIMNMEEGGPVFSGRTTVDYTKVKFHSLSKWVWGFWPTKPTLTNVEANSFDFKDEKLVYFIDFHNPSYNLLHILTSRNIRKKNMKLTSFKMHSSLVWEWFSNFHNIVFIFHLTHFLQLDI